MVLSESARWSATGPPRLASRAEEAASVSFSSLLRSEGGSSPKPKTGFSGSETDSEVGFSGSEAGFSGSEAGFSRSEAGFLGFEAGPSDEGPAMMALLQRVRRLMPPRPTGVIRNQGHTPS